MERSRLAPRPATPREPAETGVDDGLDRLADLLRGRRALLLSGAGISTESGIPDYRGPARRGRPPNPMRYQQFVKSPAARRRYWARSAVGWPAVDAARPNAGHRAVASLEEAGVLAGVLTQNVDGLHQAAGSRRVIELHGSLAAVRCLACGARSSRRGMQRTLLELNPEFAGEEASRIAPDGDAETDEARLERFRVPPCGVCGGVLKPDVVFFGENVPRARVERAWRMLGEVDAIVVAGSSLTVRSGYRFVVRAAEEGKPVAIVNDGPTRGDDDAELRVAGRLGELLPALAERVTSSAPRR